MGATGFDSLVSGSNTRGGSKILHKHLQNNKRQIQRGPYR